MASRLISRFYSANVLLLLATLFIYQQSPAASVEAFKPKHVGRNIISSSAHLGIRASKRNKHVLNIRGGSYMQPNPSYDDPNQFMPPKFGDVENDHIRRSHPSMPPSNYDPSLRATRATPKPIAQVIREFFIRLYESSPALFYGTTSSIFIFLLWQLPSNFISATLRRHFICSQYNLSNKRYHTLITSAISHTTLSHIFMNLFGFLTFGKTVEPMLKRNQMSLPTFCILAAMFANVFFVKLHPQGSCIGLSGVSLALLALDAKLHPAKEIGFLVRFIPVRLPAQYALTALLVWSVFGMMATKAGRGDGVAHATHFGGLVFGIAVHELMKRGIWSNWRKKWIRVWLMIAPRHGSNKRKIGNRRWFSHVQWLNSVECINVFSFFTISWIIKRPRHEGFRNLGKWKKHVLTRIMNLFL